MGDSTRSSKLHANETSEQREKRLAYHREWMRRFRAANPERAREAARKWAAENPDKVRAASRKRYLRNKEKIIAAVCEYARKNREKINQSNRRRREGDPEKYKELGRLRYLRNRAKDKEARAKKKDQYAAYMRHKRNTDPSFLVADRLRRRINSALSSSGAPKAGHLVDVSGCSVKDLAAHIEKQFLPGMTWENRRQWHIDHIVPCSAFDLTDPAQQSVAFHFTNLRPVWAEENQRKREKIPGCQRQFFWTHKDIAKARRNLRRKES